MTHPPNLDFTGCRTGPTARISELPTHVQDPTWGPFHVEPSGHQKVFEGPPPPAHPPLPSPRQGSGRRDCFSPSSRLRNSHAHPRSSGEARHQSSAVRGDKGCARHPPRGPLCRQHSWHSPHHLLLDPDGDVCIAGLRREVRQFRPGGALQGRPQRQGCPEGRRVPCAHVQEPERGAGEQQHQRAEGPAAQPHPGGREGG